MSPTGSDANSGLSPSAAWATPNHAVNCGDVIVAPAGTYNGAFNRWGVVSNCPSTSGGIDGAGGINFAVLLCGGSDLGSNGCLINCATAACSAGVVGSGGRSGTSSCMDVNSNDWAIEGWTCNGNGYSHRAFQADGCLTTSTVVHHIAFINDIAYNAGQGYDTDDCGYDTTHPGNGVDYFAVIGSIAQNAASDTICLAAIDDVGPANSDTNSGTHVLIYGNFAIYNVQSQGCASDGEGIMFDTWDAHGYQAQGIIADNIVYQSARAGVQLFYQNYNNTYTATTWKVYDNTFYADEQANTNSSVLSEINVQSKASTLPHSVSIINNIAQTEYRYQGNNSSNAQVFAAMWGGAYRISNGSSGTQDVLKGLAQSCPGTCDSGDNAVVYNGGSLGTNIYTSPAFTNTSDLLTNRIGAPNCTGFATTTTACMGWNAGTATLTTPSVISDLTPTASGMAGKGYQLPSTTCAANSDYPTWLKGVVYLSWNGASITEMPGLVTKPCGL